MCSILKTMKGMWSIQTCKSLFSTSLMKRIRTFYSHSYGRNSFISFKGDAEQKIVNLSDMEEKKKQMIEMEMKIEKECGNYFIPDCVSEKHWRQLLQLKTIIQRRNFYKYLKKIEHNEQKKKNRKLRKEEFRKNKLKETINKNPDHIQYGLGHNFIYKRYSDSELDRTYQNNLCHAIMFGQKIVIDIGFEDVMNLQELKSCVYQIKCCYTSNKLNKDPFYLHLCNAKFDGPMVEQLKLTLPFLQKSHPLVNLTNKSYLDIFPKDKLVYLIPDCDKNLENYNHDDIYIIGGLVSKKRTSTRTLARAKEDGLRVAYFPLEKYLRWQHYNRNVTIDQAMKILLTMKDTMSWTKAFNHIPKRKIIHQLQQLSFQNLDE